MPRRELSGIWRLVDQHGVHGADGGARERRDVVEHGRVRDELLKQKRFREFANANAETPVAGTCRSTPGGARPRRSLGFCSRRVRWRRLGREGKHPSSRLSHLIKCGADF
jgi:hypothetical protein